MSTKTAALYPFDGTDANLPPVDASANTEISTTFSGGTPALTDGVTGPARAFAGAAGFTATELVAGSTRLTRDITIEARVRTGSITGDDRTILQRGKRGSSTERMLYRLYLTSSDDITATVHLDWDYGGGTLENAVTTTFQLPSTTEYFELAATRKWISLTEVVCEFWVNGTKIGSVTSANGDIDEGVGGTMLIGCGANGALITDYFSGDIDSIRLSNVQRSDEELRHVFRGTFVERDRGYAAVRALAPIDVYSDQSTSIVDREFRVEGDAIGDAVTKIAEFRDILPDRSWWSLDRWEAITGQVPRPYDTFAQRRARVVSALSGGGGYSVSGIKQAMSEVFSLAESDVSLLSYSNEYDDTFDGGALESWWHVNGTVTNEPTPDVLGFDVGVGDRAAWATGEEHLIAHAIDGDFRDDIDYANGAEATIEVNSYTLNSGDMAGLFFYRPDRSCFFFGVYHNGANAVIASLSYTRATGWFVNGTYEDPIVGSLPQWLRVRMETAGSYECFWASADPYVAAAGGGDVIETVSGVNTPLWIGVGIARTTTSTGVNSVFSTSRYRAFFRNGTRPFAFHAYRNPALGGDYDLLAARRVFRRIKAADSEGGAVDVTQIVCDSPDSVCDGGPLG